MKRKATYIVLVLVLPAVLLLAGCARGQLASSAPGAESGQSAVGDQSSDSVWDTSPRRSNAGRVVIDVRPVNLGNDQESWSFDVAFNTHSVNLDYDLAQVSVLRCDRGQEYKPISWEGSPPGGHHRQGVLRVVPLDHASSFIEIVIKDVANVPERVFRWEKATQ